MNAPHPNRAAWLSDPEAKRLLADCAKSPPPRKTFRYAFGDTETRYAGVIGDKRVPALRKIRDRYLDEALVAGDREQAQHELDMTVDRAIDEAIAAAGMGVAA